MRKNGDHTKKRHDTSPGPGYVVCVQVYHSCPPVPGIDWTRLKTPELDSDIEDNDDVAAAKAKERRRRKVEKKRHEDEEKRAREEEEKRRREEEEQRRREEEEQRRREEEEQRRREEVERRRREEEEAELKKREEEKRKLEEAQRKAAEANKKCPRDKGEAGPSAVPVYLLRRRGRNLRIHQRWKQEADGVQTVRGNEGEV
ncbi:hypothetical protein BU15DRAFT_68257 [Melanogaster broomeanus]|nr:hypothetical protein BU15DRAFT_68257 [Melanogaster broomeanus]